MDGLSTNVSLSFSSFVSRRGLSNTNQRLSLSLSHTPSGRSLFPTLRLCRIAVFSLKPTFLFPLSHPLSHPRSLSRWAGGEQKCWSQIDSQIPDADHARVRSGSELKHARVRSGPRHYQLCALRRVSSRILHFFTGTRVTVHGLRLKKGGARCAKKWRQEEASTLETSA